MQQASLLIVFESGGTAVPLARSDDNELLVLAAKQAIAAKRVLALRAAAIDPRLGEIAMEEADQLQARLRTFIPGFQNFTN